MDERMQQQQRQWLEAARRHHGPSEHAVRGMRRGLRARIEAGEPAPAWEETATAAATPTRRWQPWIVGAAVLLAAAAVLLWSGRGSQRELARKADPNAAELDAAPRQQERATARAGGEAGSSASATAGATVRVDHPAGGSSFAGASAGGDPRHPPRVTGTIGAARAVNEAREDGPRPRSGATPDREAGSAGLLIPASPSPALDVAGEATVLRRAKAAIERKAWDEATAALDAYDREHPGAVLAPEAGALRVMVACGRGAIDASARAEAFVQRHPGSPLRERIGRECGIDPEP
jgi:hypothetical protein